MRKHLTVFVITVLFVVFAPMASSYSVLSHEQIVDLAWKDHIVPALMKRFPGTNDDQLKMAHAYAYGGCMIQDMGYYPSGNRHFSDLVHYVRSGDFVTNLIREAQDVNDYAFALGALAHYASDTMGHPAVNRAVPIEFPKLQRKFGNRVTYEDGKSEHIRTEFGFDVVQVAKNRYTSDAYHDFIGFAVAKESLARAFRDTYGFDIDEIFANEDHTIGSFRWAVGALIPKMTKVALVAHEKDMMKENSSFDRQKFLYRLSRAQYEHDWGKNYQRPGFGTRVLAFILRILPKIGPLKKADIKVPTPQTEQLYLKSMNDSVDLYDRLVDQAAKGPLQLANKDFDTGAPTKPGEYRMSDEAYAFVMHQLAEHKFTGLTPDLRAEILRFYADANTNPKLATKRKKKDWEELQKDLAELKSAAAADSAAKASD
jgi:Zinc dependent phospholipase C